MKHNKCPFCKGEITSMFTSRYGWWACGCFNTDCVIAPKTGYHNNKKRAEELWDSAFKEDSDASTKS